MFRKSERRGGLIGRKDRIKIAGKAAHKIQVYVGEGWHSWKKQGQIGFGLLKIRNNLGGKKSGLGGDQVRDRGQKKGGGRRFLRRKSRVLWVKAVFFARVEGKSGSSEGAENVYGGRDGFWCKDLAQVELANSRNHREGRGAGGKIGTLERFSDPPERGEGKK